MEITNKQVFVDYDPAKSRFVIKCPVWANEYIGGLPNRRWNKAAGGWVAPMIRRNIEFMVDELMKNGYAEFSASASKAIKEAQTKLSEEIKESGFPAWYRFKTKPRDHQAKCLNKLYPLIAAAMHMDRGTGKTKTAIDMICARRMDAKIGAVVVVCKLSGRRTWQEEFEIHSPLPASIFLPHTNKQKDFDKWLRVKHDLKVMVVGAESLSVGGMGKMVERFMLCHNDVMMVIDESHMISNPKALRAVQCVYLRTMAKYRLTLTGTPISTGPMNLFMQFEFLDPDIIGIGDYYSFRNRYAVMGGYRDERGRAMQIVGYQNIDELARTVAPYVFEVRKSDVLDLPPKVFKKVYVQLTKEQRALYDKIKKEQAYEIDGREMIVKNVLESALRLHQVCGGYSTTYSEEERAGKKVRVPHIHELVPWKKNPKIMELLDIAADGKSMIVWCAYRPEIAAVVAALKATFPKEEIGEIHGGVSEEDRHTIKNKFQSGKVRILVGNTATGGTSLTLTACEIMVYYNNTEKMVDREQSEDRAHRDGLKHSVLYIDLIAEKTVDETIIKSIGQKMNLSEYIRLHIADASRLLGGT